MSTPLGLAALTVLDTPPLQHVDLAERHGFDTIGLRLLPAAPGTTAYPLHEDDAALSALVRRLADSPVQVFDLEIIRLGPDFDPSDYAPLLEAGARLGARAVLVGGDDPDRARLTDSYARLAELCASYGIVASLEFMPWTAVPDAKTAVEIVAGADGPARSVLVDALHVARSSTTVADLAAIPREWLHYAQMCDGATPAPRDHAELIRHAREERLVPGTGGIDLPAIWSALPEGLPVSIELPNEPLRQAIGTDAWLEQLVTATGAVLGRVPATAIVE
ncbi:sugar phosphate isomerase/epimerase [Rhodococcus aetherivorans]|uniref:Possible sugar phosphate isomerase/epimerase n=1 Tax=Rhodococcus aetherivorans TaxID=191292 RepID=A0ABQ0YND2_9NOCA|nr:sugar phosphate isomerase/epimerase [Rhodococcus aetherivorans]ETT25844.1 Xylose isomerase domain-containing protein TIM barrel [Rhodococcus rhodochrous ATCC 21198]KDE11126.1 xylose isomerase [Rhodococcus aetherivorans]MDV6292993.1 sugar phosphate isomerase/epimerase [Rhodococcus aetherivorans]NGP25331.1 sugar phosphate isomerase/epimerase [Rhodococcus aetherivorans]CCW14177.1 possible sugar phosphate isomerase/ epimerase [Rhodococcus aetherivorans]